MCKFIWVDAEKFSGWSSSQNTFCQSVCEWERTIIFMLVGIVGKMSANNGEIQTNRHKERHDMSDRKYLLLFYIPKDKRWNKRTKIVKIIIFQ